MFQESLRALDQQAAQRDDLRTRAGALLAAASIVTAFFGSRALDDPRGPDMGTWIAVASFAVLVGVCSYVLAPRQWVFVTSADELLRQYAEGDRAVGIDAMHRDLALHFESHHAVHRRGLRRMTTFLQGTSVLLLVEIAGWLVHLQGKG